MIDPLLFVLGLALVLGGAEWLVRGSSRLAKALGMPPVLVGVTIVAFGTSAPEFAINAVSALQGNTGLAFGNIAGSNLANIGLILGICAVVRPLQVHSGLIRREIPLMVAATLAFLVLGTWLGAPDTYDRRDGIVLLGAFAAFLVYTIADVLRLRYADAYAREAEEATPPPKADGLRDAAIAVVGLAVLLVGSRLTVDSGMRLAARFGVPDNIIGLTLVAIGTSLPELATSLVATLRGHVDLAVGNVVGSNLFNILWILGATAVIAPVAVPAGGYVDLGVLAAVSALLLPLAITHDGRIVRGEGLLLLAIYVAFCGWRVFGVA